MTKAEIDAIVGGYHGDPFHLLGPHAVKRRNKPASWEVRAFLPQAAGAEVLLGEEARPAERRYADGFFVASIEGQPRPTSCG